jgi:hypothetical protein
MFNKNHSKQKCLYIKALLFFICFFFIFFELFTKNNSFSKDFSSEILNIEINNSKNELLVSFFSNNHIHPEFQEVLKSGIPLRYIYEIEIIEEGLIRDSKLFSESIVYQINYDNLKDEIRVINYNSNIKVFSLKQFNEAEAIIFENQNFKIDTKNLYIKKGRSYFVKIRSIIERMDSKMDFGFLPFLHSKSIVSPWNELKFLY